MAADVWIGELRRLRQQHEQLLERTLAFIEARVATDPRAEFTSAEISTAQGAITSWIGSRCDSVAGLYGF
jgi:hypothetical protein